jgi:hypothetical protein
MKSLSGTFDAKTVAEALPSCERMMRIAIETYGERPTEERFRRFVSDYVATPEEVDELVRVSWENEQSH